MSSATLQLITAEEFARLPNPVDGSQQELVRGVIVTMPPPKGLHGACCWKVAFKLGLHIEPAKLGRLFINDTGFLTAKGPDTVRGADVSFWQAERMAVIPERYADIPPDLAVEVVSPDDHFARLNRKLFEYMALRIRLVWIVDPEDRSVTVYRPDQPPRILGENDTLSGEDVLPGFSCVVRELFP